MIRLLSSGEKTIEVRKTVCQVTELSMQEARDFVDSTPRTVKEAVTREEAAAIKQRFEQVPIVEIEQFK